MKFSKTVNIIGCGFAGIECALFLARHGINVHIFDKDFSNYKCDRFECEHISKSKDINNAHNLLREELKILGSSLLEEEYKLSHDGLIECGCVASRLLEYGRNLLKNYKNIKIFNVNIKEIDVEELNVIATGPHTDKELYLWLKENFGSMRVFDGFSQSLIVENVDESLMYKKENDKENLYYPFNYDEYIAFCNKIIKARNDFCELNNIKLGQSELAIENIVLKGKDELKNKIMRPCKLLGYNERPYAVLQVEKIASRYKIKGFASFLSQTFQDMIISSLKPFKNCKIVCKGKVLNNFYINSPFVINYFSQSNKFENIFFAGSLAGFDGHLEAMASGLYVGYNIMTKIVGKSFLPIPTCTLLGSMMKKITLNSLNFSPIIANYDIIKENNSDNSFSDVNLDILARSKDSLKKFMEDYNGRIKI